MFLWVIEIFRSGCVEIGFYYVDLKYMMVWNKGLFWYGGKNEFGKLI